MADLTYVATQEGWLYLAGIKDVYTCEIVGYAMGEHMTKELTGKALFMALRSQRPPAGLIHHSDRGSQYCAYDYRLDQFLDEKEGNHTTAYRDGAGIWTICRGAILVDGKPVVPGMKLSKEKCDRVNAIERDKALAWVEKNIRVPLSEPQKAGIASFCPYNIGPGKCFPSTFYKRINAGDRRGACEAIRWWIKDGGRDCRIRSNNCYGQVSRRDQESALACWGIDR